MVIAVLRRPSTGSIRVIRWPVRSVIQSMLSGPQVTSEGPAKPETSILLLNRLVPRMTDSGLSCS